MSESGRSIALSLLVIGFVLQGCGQALKISGTGSFKSDKSGGLNEEQPPNPPNLSFALPGRYRLTAIVKREVGTTVYMDTLNLYAFVSIPNDRSSINGRGPCNGFFGNMKVRDLAASPVEKTYSMTIENLVSSEAACANNSEGAIEEHFFMGLLLAKSAVLYDEGRTLLIESQERILKLTREDISEPDIPPPPPCEQDGQNACENQDYK